MQVHMDRHRQQRQRISRRLRQSRVRWQPHRCRQGVQNRIIPYRISRRLHQYPRRFIDFRVASSRTISLLPIPIITESLRCQKVCGKVIIQPQVQVQTRRCHYHHHHRQLKYHRRHHRGGCHRTWPVSPGRRRLRLRRHRRRKCPLGRTR
jgi:hypothetical protein